jgi:hypothetical protein
MVVQTFFQWNKQLVGCNVTVFEYSLLEEGERRGKELLYGISENLNDVTMRVTLCNIVILKCRCTCITSGGFVPNLFLLVLGSFRLPDLLHKTFKNDTKKQFILCLKGFWDRSIAA